MTHIVDDLTWRALISQSTDLGALRHAIDDGGVTYYCGFDPTAPSLHIGHLVQVITLRRLQLAGNRPIALVGGATGLIGDPRMSGERTLNDPDTVAGWVDRLRGQIMPLLDFDGPYGARMVNNLEWTASLTAIELLRDVGKHYRLGTMLAKDIVARRLASDQGISFTEFSYQILQGMDFLELYRRHGCTLQTGGNDQWGNLVSGVDLIRKTEGTSVHAFSTPLLTKADGTKFGKTEGGAVWLDPDMTSPYAFYQFWLNTADADVVGYLRALSLRSREELDAIAAEAAQRPGARAAQRTLAEEMTTLVHGARAAKQVTAASQALFGVGDLRELDPGTLAAAVAELPSADLGDLGAGPWPLADVFAASGIVASKSAARRAIADGGAYVNNRKVDSADAELSQTDLLHGAHAVLRRGKKTLAVARLTAD